MVRVGVGARLRPRSDRSISLADLFDGLDDLEAAAFGSSNKVGSPILLPQLASAPL